MNFFKRRFCLRVMRRENIYCATYVLRTGVGEVSAKYSFNARDNGGALRMAKVHAQKLRKAFGRDVFVTLCGVVDRRAMRVLYSASTEGDDAERIAG
jgi:hypothetical protein